MIQACAASLTEGRFTTITDDPEVLRYIRQEAESLGLKTHLEEMGGEYYLHFSPQTRLTDREKPKPSKDLIILIRSDTLGQGEDTLGKALMKGFFYGLKRAKPCPKAILFLNRGIYLTTEGSEVLEDLKGLWEMGVEILSSSTCLDFYNRKQKLLVGGVAGMGELVEKMTRGENTLTI
jgi:selenium metabolism protein YedF